MRKRNFYIRTIVVLAAIIFLAGTGIAKAENISFDARLEQSTASKGNPVYLYLTFYGTRDAEEPDMPQQDGLRIKYVGPSMKMSVVNGKVTQSVSHAYLVIPLKEGIFKIGPFFAEYRGKTYNADAVTLTSVAGSAAVSGGAPSYNPGSSSSASSSGTVQNVPAHLEDDIFLVMETVKERVYINEGFPVTLKVYVRNMGLKDIEYPSYPHEGFSVGEFSEPERTSEFVRGDRYDVLLFKQDVFGIKEGDYVLGPGSLKCKVVIRKAPSVRSRTSLFGFTIDDDFFSNRSGYSSYPVELASKALPVTILPFPSTGRPADFKGAVGDFQMDARIVPADVKVGDPITLTMTISGKGNMDTVTAPQVASDERFKTYEPQVTKKDGKKIYEQILIPRTEEIKDVPAVTFSFFDSKTESYQTITKGPFKVNVAAQPESERKVKMVSMPGMQQGLYSEEKLGWDITHIKDKPGDIRKRGRFLYESWLFWLVQLAIVCVFGVFYNYRRKKERIMTDRGYARFLKAPRKARTGLSKARSCLGKEDMLPFYDTVFRTLQEYLGDRFNLPKGGVTVDAIEKKVCTSGCDEVVIKALHDVFSKCEMARYASSTMGKEDAAETMGSVEKIIDYFEKNKF